MCGILGQFAWSADLDSPERLHGLLALLKHRGPDHTGHWAEGLYWFGHQRLSIIDLVSGDQPMVSPDGRLAVVFNGEIYNYQELRVELEAMGYPFRTTSDTEVLLHGYHAWGTELPRRLAGMFAFAIADRSERALFVSRDRLGEKPLFVWEEEGRVTFASQLKVFFAMERLPKRVSEEALCRFLLLNYVPGEQSLLKSVRKVMPGTWKLYRPDGVREGCYWSVPERRPRNIRFEDALEEFKTKLDHSVALTLRSDVPVGIFLSGGIDSSLVAESAARQGNLSRAFCLAFEEASFSEYDQAKVIADRLGIPLTKVLLSPSALTHFLDLVRYGDDPLADSSALAVYTLAREASRHNKVVLSGDGGDEIFGGYLTYKASMLHRRHVARLPRWLRAALARAADHLSVSEAKVSTSYKLARFLRAADLPTREAHFTWNGSWMPNTAATLLQPELRPLIQRTLAELAKTLVPGRDSLTDFQQADLRNYLADDILVKVDRMTMAHGLESRTPYLHSDIVDFAFSLPESFHLSPKGQLKRLLRARALDVVGKSIALAPKQGFSLPVHRWLRERPGRDYVEDLLSRERLQRLAFLDTDRVLAQVRSHLSGKRALGFEIWGLLVLSAWHRQMTEATDVPSTAFCSERSMPSRHASPAHGPVCRSSESGIPHIRTTAPISSSEAPSSELQ